MQGCAPLGNCFTLKAHSFFVCLFVFSQYIWDENKQNKHRACSAYAELHHCCLFIITYYIDNTRGLDTASVWNFIYDAAFRILPIITYSKVQSCDMFPYKITLFVYLDIAEPNMSKGSNLSYLPVT